MKNIFSKIEVSPFFIILALLFLISGLFKNFLIFTAIILVHELGHISASLISKDQFIKIKLYPAGGIVTFNEVKQKSFSNTLLILISGFISQTIMYYFITIAYTANIIDYQTFELFETYYFAILLFNLLPIVPLDGGLIIRLIASRLASYYSALKISIWVSYIVLITTFIYLYITNFEISFIYSFLLLTYLLFISNKNNEYEFQKFLINRLDFNNLHPVNLIDNEVHQIKKYKNNYALKSSHIISEKNIIKNYFKLT